MKDEKSIIEDYREGNFETRLNLFLECRHLRDEFVRIDYEEFEVREKEGIKIKPVSSFLGRRMLAIYPFSRFSKWCRG